MNTEIKKRKVSCLDQIRPEVWNSRKFDGLLLQYFNAVYNQKTINRGTKDCIHPFPKKGELGIARKYRVITLTSILLLRFTALCYSTASNPKLRIFSARIKIILFKNRTTTSQILTILRIIEEVREKNSRQL